MSFNAISVVMGGGQGARLYPLTAERAKPAVPLAGKYRLIDVAVSNCLNSGITRIFVLTQFNSVSLNRHLMRTYQFDSFSSGFVQILAAQQTTDNMDWYQGTADAVRQNLPHIHLERSDYVLVLSGDQLYRMDFRKMLNAHRLCDADITVAVTPVPEGLANRYGVLQTDERGWIKDFVEKPEDEELIRRLRVPKAAFDTMGMTDTDRTHVASMGIYVFTPQVLREVLEDRSHSDFGRDVIPAAIRQRRVLAHVHQGYWEDIGTVRSFFEANLALTDVVPAFDFFDTEAPMYTNRRLLPASKINECTMKHCVVADGCIIDQSVLERCLVGIRSVIGSGCRIANSVLMGADYYESDTHRAHLRAHDRPPLGIGRNAVIRNAIVDKNTRIGENVKLVNESGAETLQGDGFDIVDGIIVVRRNAVIASGTCV